MARKKNNSLEQSNAVNNGNYTEVIGLLLIAFSALLFLSLISFSHGDAGSNWLGLLGYVIAFSFQYLFGITGYLLAGLVTFAGWRLLCNRPICNHPIKWLYLSCSIFSLCILCSLFSEVNPNAASNFSSSIYTEELVLKKPISQKIIRHYLGGRPAYYFYRDIHAVNLQQILSNVGIALIFSTLLFVFLMLLTQLSISPFIRFIHRYLFQRGPPGSIIKYFTGTYAYSKKLLQRMKNIFHRVEETQAMVEVPVARPNKSILKKPKQEIRGLLPSKTMQLEEPPADIENKKREQHSPIINTLTPSSSKPFSKPISRRQAALKAQKIYNGDFKNYKLPSSTLLTDPKKINQPSLERDLRKQAEVLEETLLNFGIEAKVGEINCGPTITSFEVHPAIGVKVQRIKALENDIALNMQAKSIRIIAPIPGKAAVGIEIPAQQSLEVNFKEMLNDYHSSNISHPIPILLGKTVSGENVISDLSRMPHCIIAGATGTGKSVCINTFVISILMNCKPDEVKLLLIDPKKVELTSYSSLPHMLSPVITEPPEVIAALKWLVREMERRYDILKHLGVRNIASFNSRSIDKEFEESPDTEIPKHMFYIVCIIDELADLMMLSSNEIEMPIARIAQMARAVGIHLVLATQRPSREVITGLIKANFPTRISFKVASRVNSQIILDEIGAESLLGNGDMLFQPPGASALLRTQGCFIHDKDISATIRSICGQAPPNYLIDSFDHMANESDEAGSLNLQNSSLDPLFERALDLVQRTGSISTTFIQRKLKIGYARAAGIMDQLEEQGIITPPDGSKPRKLLITSKYSSESDDEFDF